MKNVNRQVEVEVAPHTGTQILARTHTSARTEPQRERARWPPRSPLQKGTFGVNDRQLTHICERAKTKAKSKKPKRKK